MEQRIIKDGGIQLYEICEESELNEEQLDPIFKELDEQSEQEDE